MRVLVFALIGSLSLAGCKRSGPEPEVPEVRTAPGTPSPSPVPTIAPVPTPTPVPVLPRKPIVMGRLFNGMTFRTKFDTPQSDEPASLRRVENDSYEAEITVTATLPRAAKTLEDLARNDSKLPEVLNKIPVLLESASVSPFFETLYKNKIEAIRRNLFALDAVLSRHNFYDCETILELKDLETNRKALLVVGDMDVNVDGSDGDRNFSVDDSGRFFQPQTSYRWPRQTDRINPLLPKAEERLLALRAEYAVPNLSTERNQELHNAIDLTTRTINDLKAFSFLVSGADPTIVLPGFMLRSSNDAYTPAVGDYAVVIYDGVVYPAIVGDAGPSFKVGEASLRLCQQINARSGANSRPVSSVKVAYLVFPGTAEKPGPPDLEHWQTLCQKYLDEIGGIAPELHSWENVILPWPTPTPTPTPAPLTETPSPQLAFPTTDMETPPTGAAPAAEIPIPEATVTPESGATPSPTETPTGAPTIVTPKDTP